MCLDLFKKCFIGYFMFKKYIVNVNELTNSEWHLTHCEKKKFLEGWAHFLILQQYLFIEQVIGQPSDHKTLQPVSIRVLWKAYAVKKIITFYLIFLKLSSSYN